jgi:hypothetical protein
MLMPLIGIQFMSMVVGVVNGGSFLLGCLGRGKGVGCRSNSQNNRERDNDLFHDFFPFSAIAEENGCGAKSRLVLFKH